LGGRRLVGKTQQPTKSWRLLWGGYWGGRATAVERVGGAFCYRLGATNKVTKNKKMKTYVVALDGRQSAKKHTTTNQKQAATMEGTMEGRRDEREAWGSAISLFFGGGEV